MPSPETMTRRGRGAVHQAVVALAVLACGALRPNPAMAVEAASCPQMQFPASPLPSAPGTQVDIHADRVQLDQRGLSTLTGDVRVARDGREFIAPSLKFDSLTQLIEANQPSLFRDPHLIIQSQRARFYLDLGRGLFSGTRFTLPSRGARGGAGEIKLSQSGQAELQHASYTSCAPDDEAWILQARDIKLDRSTGLGRARDAVLRIEGVPVLYLPYFQFPIDGRRRTGLLYPTVGQSSQTGFDIRWPLYLNLAANYDDTFTPRYTSRRGTLLDNQFRYLLPANRGMFEYEYLNYDRVTGHERSFIHYQHEGLLTPDLGLNVDFAQVSDRDFFNTFGGTRSGSDLDTSATPYLPRGATLTYQGGSNFTLQALLQSYQPLTRFTTATDEPYKRVPQIRASALTANALWQTRAGFDGDFTNFERRNSTQGQRAYLDPYLSWQIDRLSWFADARADYTYTGYQLTAPQPGQSRSPKRSLPLFSGELGARFSRVTDDGSLEIVEPQLFYLYVPYRDQNGLPNFDAGEPDFDFPQLFARNRFSGEDRISDANQLTTALTGRLLDPDTGIVRLTASLGEIYRIQAPRVTLPGLAQPSEGFSDLLTFFNYRIDPRWEARSTTEVSPKLNAVSRADVELRYRDDRHLLDLAYRYRQGLLQQTDLSLLTPVIGNWKIAGRVQYSLRYHNALTSFVGVEYDTCCWAFRGTYRRYLANSNGDYSSGVFFQIELKGLTRIGHGFESLLPTGDGLLDRPLGR